MTIKFSNQFVERGGWWVVGQFALFGLILIALTRNTDPADALRVVGWVLVGAAIVLGGSGLWMIRDKITAMPAPVAGAVLVEHGPFALARHPIYGAVILGFLGLSIKGGNVYAAALSLSLVPFFYFKTEHEERLLTARFPEYEEYRQRVTHRILPWIL